VEGMTIRSMTLSDVEGGMRLSKAEGWNQTENDWKLFIADASNVCLLAESENKIVGTTTAINYGKEAWIGMVLVDKEYRGLGISKALLSRIFAALSSSRSLKLDATAAGQPVYQKFGFKNEYLISRMVNVSVKEVPVQISNSNVEAMSAENLSEIISLDETVFGANRKQLINFYLKNILARRQYRKEMEKLLPLRWAGKEVGISRLGQLLPLRLRMQKILFRNH